MLTDDIKSNWNMGPLHHAIAIADMPEDYPAWTVKFGNEYGVAISFETKEAVSEEFSGAHMYSTKILLDGQVESDALLLTAFSQSIQTPFSALCAEFISPGADGTFRKEILSSPVLWWAQWKELLGNKNIDARVYDVLGELCVLKELTQRGKNVFWNGPEGASYDFESDDEFFEVKSSIIRSRREITVSNPQQLQPPKGKLYLVLCQFEPSQTGYCINTLVNEVCTLGHSRTILNDKLKRLGFEVGKSSRNKTYLLHNVICYPVDEKFPVINNSSFIGGKMPKGIEKITYTVSLDSIDGEFWIGQV